MQAFARLFWSNQSNTSSQAQPMSHHVTTVTDDEKGRTYQECIPFERDHGLIKIHNSDCHSITEQPINLTIERHPSQHVEIIASIPYPEVLDLDPSHPNTNTHDGKLYKFHENNMLWKPFQTDVIQDEKTKYRSTAPRLDKLRGGNRLTINLTSQYFFRSTLNVLTYIIRIPNDADLYVDLPVGDITYVTHPACSRNPEAKHTVATRLRGRCDRVNVYGQSGGGANWDYFWGSESDPITDLQTKKGSLTLPDPDPKTDLQTAPGPSVAMSNAERIDFATSEAARLDAEAKLGRAGSATGS